MKSNILLLVVLLSANQISAYCFFNPAPIGLPAGGQPAVCTYNDQTYSPGDSWDTDNCEECHCLESGAFGCCGFGFHAGVMNYGVGCEIDRVDCLNGVLKDEGEPGSCSEAGMKIHLPRSK